MITRRNILFGFIAAPLVIRSGILMPVRPVKGVADAVLMPSKGRNWYSITYSLDGGIHSIERIDEPKDGTFAWL